MSKIDSQKQEKRGTGVPLGDFSTDAQTLSAADFEERHGSAFLVVTATDLDQPSGPAMTQVALDGFDEPGSERTADVSLLAYPVLRTERSVGHLITVGRTSNNDVVIPDLSVSRFHAFVKPSGDGRFQIQDARSTNGTTVNGNSVPSQGNGPAVDLKSGDNLRLGQVELTFLGAEALRNFVLAHEG
jgi:pSer/pThr/pTyr-binding forkhead associated (FHA) protein